MIQINDIISGVILCGGKSSRMGRNKSEVMFNNISLLNHAQTILLKHFAKVYVSSNKEQSSNFVVPDIHKNIGPIGGIHACLSLINSDYLFVLGCDMPFVTTEIINKLIENIDNYDIIVPSVNGKIEPLCAIYSKKILNSIEKKIEKQDFKLLNLITDCNALYINFEDEEHFKNFNTIDDLKKYPNQFDLSQF